jgi:hypothetical protein
MKLHRKGFVIAELVLALLFVASLLMLLLYLFTGISILLWTAATMGVSFVALVLFLIWDTSAIRSGKDKD